MLPSYPICLEWLNFDPTVQDSTGNFVILMLKYNIKLAVGTYSKLHKFVSFSTLKLQEKYCIKNYINIFFIKKIPGHRIFLFLRRE